MNNKVFCLECNKYFENVEKFNQVHNDKVSFQVMKVKHNYIIEGNCLAYISKIFADNSKIMDIIREQNNKIQIITSKLNYYEDALKNDVTFECNIIIKNVENKIDQACLLHFFPKSVHFKIQCNGNIVFKGRKEFEIQILFPFKASDLKISSIEKLQGCIFSQKVLNSAEQETIIFNNYSSSIIQKNNLTSIKLLKNYYSQGFLEQKKIDVIINGILTFSSFKFDISLPFIIFNINQKKFLSYDKYNWKFVDNCFTEEGNVNTNNLVNLELDINKNEIYIKNEYKYLGNRPDFIATEKSNAKFKYSFTNTFYGIISIFNEKNYISSDEKTGLIKFSNEPTYFIIYNP